MNCFKKLKFFDYSKIILTKVRMKNESAVKNFDIDI